MSNAKKGKAEGSEVNSRYIGGGNDDPILDAIKIRARL